MYLTVFLAFIFYDRFNIVEYIPCLCVKYFLKYFHVPLYRFWPTG